MKKKVTICKLKTSLGRIFIYNFNTNISGTSAFLLQIQHDNNFLPTNKHQSQSSSLSWYFFVRLLYLPLKFRPSKCLETRSHLGSGRKTVNSQGHSELREPMKTRENCYSLIW